MRSSFQQLLGYRELLAVLIARNLKIRYKNSILGFVWTLLGPLLLIVIYSLFLNLLKVPVPLPVLVIGVLSWQFTTMCMGDALQAVAGHANLVKKTAFPRIVLPLSTVIANTVNFLLSCLVLAAYLLYARVSPGPLLWLVPVMLTHLALCLGLGFLISSLNVFFKDTEHLLSVVLLAWFFMSPIIYEYTLAFDTFQSSPWLEWLFFLNPMSGILTLYRSALLSSPLPPWEYLGASLGMSWLLLIAGAALFVKTEPYFGDEL